MTRRLSPLLAILAASTLVMSVAPALAAALNTTIGSGPSGLIASRSATFRFRSNVPSATFQCKLDGKRWSSCTSPKRYTKLDQGPHTFRVRARQGGSVDRTPAVRTFKVDTVKPQTTIGSGPSGEINDPTPSFTFSSSEAGSFQCRLATSNFTKCSSPYVPSSPLPDGSHTFQVRARDKAGNLDPTPASRSFTVERLLTADLAGAQAIAELYFPDELVMDVQPECTGVLDASLIDCPDGIALPPSDQLSITSSRAVVPGAIPNTYEVTVTSDVATLSAVEVSWVSLECALALTSAHGDTPTWTVTVDLSFDTDPGSGQPRVGYSGLEVSGVEIEDWGLGSWGELPQPCGQPGAFDSDLVTGVYAAIIDRYLSDIGSPLCAVTGPEYLGPCPPPPLP